MTITSTPMTSTTQERVAGWLFPDEFRTLEALCDTFIPSLEPPQNSDAVQVAYYRRKASDLHVPFVLAETLAQENPERQAEFRQLLGLMSNPFFSLLLVGTARPFIDLPFEKRERYLIAMANSPLGQLRQGYQALKRLIGFLFFAVPDASGVNPNWGVLDYVPAPARVTEKPSRPLQPYAVTEDVTLDCDAVIIGSGAGGGVVAGELALAGKSVIVLEKGGYYSDEDFTLQEAEAMSELYLKRGALTSRDLGTIILAGSTLGGGTVVNWNTSFRTPEAILDEWAQRSGLKDFTTASLHNSFEAVEKRTRINTENSAHNRQNQLLFDGAEALGYHAGVLRRNAVGCEQRCGTCCFGCRYGCKQSTTKTYLQDAYDHGARLIVRCTAERVLIENGCAVGVQGVVTDPMSRKNHQVTVRAKTVIVAAGSIHTPAVLLRSGLENPHIGRHLHLHPTSTITGLYSQKVYPWQGVMQSAYCDEFSQLRGNYGYKVEVAPGHPGLLGSASPWWSAREYRENMQNVPFSAVFIVLTRDKGEGRVTLDRYGEPVVDYVTSVFDRRHLLHGLRKAARLHFAAGATGVISLHTKATRLEAIDSSVTEQQWRRFDTDLERHGLGLNRITMFSAHQMGSCRMGSDARQAVVDGNQEVYGVKGLFVCDASVFPAASGVNPMLSIMGLAHKAAQYIKTVL